MELKKAKQIIENEIDGCDVFDCKMCERDCACDNSPCVEEGCQLAIAVDTVFRELDRLQKENEKLKTKNRTQMEEIKVNEIRVNDYVRTKDGFIYKIEDGEEFYEDSIDVGIGIFPEVDGIWVDQEHTEYIEKDNIKAHSPNIIDLIEENDYVNGHRVIFDESMNKLAILRINGSNIRHTAIEYFVAKNSNEQIKSIVTHEQFNSIKYEVI